MRGCHRRMVCSAMRHIGKWSYGCGLRIDNRPLTSARCRREAKLAHCNGPPDLRSDRSRQVNAPRSLFRRLCRMRPGAPRDNDALGGETWSEFPDRPCGQPASILVHLGRKTGGPRTNASHLEGQGPGRRIRLSALNSACAMRFRCRQSRFLRGCHRRTALYGSGHIGITHILPEHRKPRPLAIAAIHRRRLQRSSVW